jgi:hypothetical protein
MKKTLLALVLVLPLLPALSFAGTPGATCPDAAHCDNF